MVYPENIFQPDPVSNESRPYIVFLAKRVDFNIQKARSASDSFDSLVPQGNFTLPMPNNGLTDGSTNQYSEGPSAFGIINQGLSKTYGGDDISSHVGFVADPKMTQLYKGTKPREWSGTWLFIPQNENEAKAVQDILKSIKTWGAPDKADFADKVGILIQPYVFEIIFSNGVINDMMKLDKMALVSYSINYFNQGYASTYADGMSKQISLTLNFAEFGIKTRGDWGK